MFTKKSKESKLKLFLNKEVIVDLDKKGRQFIGGQGESSSSCSSRILSLVSCTPSAPGKR